MFMAVYFLLSQARSYLKSANTYQVLLKSANTYQILLKSDNNDHITQRPTCDSTRVGDPRVGESLARNS
jgi:hypothetical protein